MKSSEIEQKGSTRDHGVASKQNVVIMSESTQFENPKIGKKSSQVRYVKANVLETHLSEEVNEMIKE